MEAKILEYINGEPEITEIEIPIERANTELERQALRNLTTLIRRFGDAKTHYDVLQHFYTVNGYIRCCRDIGLLTEESATNLLQNAEYMADKMLIRMGNGNVYGFNGLIEKR